jgi:hypothetical protein
MIDTCNAISRPPVETEKPPARGLKKAALAGAAAGPFIAWADGFSRVKPETITAINAAELIVLTGAMAFLINKRRTALSGPEKVSHDNVINLWEAAGRLHHERSNHGDSQESNYQNQG